MRFVHKIINNFIIKQRAPLQNGVDFGGTELYCKCSCKLDRLISLQEKRDLSSISTAANNYETFPQGKMSFIYGRQLEPYFNTFRQRGVETLGWNVRRNCNYGQTRTRVRGNFRGIFKYLECSVYFLALILRLSAAILFRLL